MDIVIRCPFCRTKVTIGGVCSKCKVGFPGDGPVVTRGFNNQKPRKVKSAQPIFNRIRIPNAARV